MSDVEEQGGMKRGHDDDLEQDGARMKRRRGDGPNVELRLLLASKNAGAIIGKGGSNIKRLRSDYKASVTVPDSNGPERILTVGANLGTACDVLQDVIPTLEDYQAYKNSDDYNCEIRMLVHQSQAGCIIGRAGFKIKELREQTGANIKVYSQCCPQSTERTVQVSGKPSVVVDCVHAIYELLQSAPPKGFNNPYDPHNFDEYIVQDYGGYTMESGRGGGRPMGRGGPRGGMRGGRGGMDGGGFGMRGSGMRGGMGGGMGGGMRGRGGRGGRGPPGGYGFSERKEQSRGSSNGYGRSGGMGGGGGGMGQNFASDTMGMGNQGMMFGNQQSTQVSIPKDLAGAIIGKGGSRIKQIRSESGAGITIDEPVQGSTDRIITITGTQDQIQNAQYLLQMSVKQHSGKY